LTVVNLDGLSLNPDHLTDRQLEDASIPLLDEFYANELKNNDRKVR